MDPTSSGWLPANQQIHFELAHLIVICSHKMFFFVQFAWRNEKSQFSFCTRARPRWPKLLEKWFRSAGAIWKIKKKNRRRQIGEASVVETVQSWEKASTASVIKTSKNFSLQMLYRMLTSFKTKQNRTNSFLFCSTVYIFHAECRKFLVVNCTIAMSRAHMDGPRPVYDRRRICVLAFPLKHTLHYCYICSCLASRVKWRSIIYHHTTLKQVRHTAVDTVAAVSRATLNVLQLSVLWHCSDESLITKRDMAVQHFFFSSPCFVSIFISPYVSSINSARLLCLLSTPYSFSTMHSTFVLAVIYENCGFATRKFDFRADGDGESDGWFSFHSFCCLMSFHLLTLVLQYAILEWRGRRSRTLHYRLYVGVVIWKPKPANISNALSLLGCWYTIMCKLKSSLAPPADRAPFKSTKRTTLIHINAMALRGCSHK